MPARVGGGADNMRRQRGPRYTGIVRNIQYMKFYFYVIRFVVIIKGGSSSESWGDEGKCLGEEKITKGNRRIPLV